MQQPPSDYQRTHKKYIQAIILIGLFTTSLCLSILGPFFPLQASNYDIDQSKIGIIFSGFPLGAIACTFAIRKQMTLYRKPFMMTGIFLQVVGMVGFATIFLWDNESTIIAIAVVLRICMGIGQSMFETPALSFLPLLFSDKMDKMLGLMEGVQSVGLMLGPLLGTLLYYIDGYSLVFYGMGCIQFLALPIAFFLIPNFQQVRNSFRANSKFTCKSSSMGPEYDLQISLLQNDPKFEESVTSTSYRKAFKNFRIFLIFSLIFLTAYGFLFLDSAFAIYLDGQFNLGQHTINYIFVGSNFCCMLACRIVSCFSEKQYNSLRLCITGFVLSLVCYFFIGPADIFPFDPILILTIIMRCIIALSQSLVYVPAMKEFNNTLTSIFHMNNDEEQIGNMASTLYVIAQQVGELFGPLIGDTICEYRSFQDATFYLAAFSLSAVILIYAFKFLFKVDEIQQIVYRSNSKSFYESLGKQVSFKESNNDTENQQQSIMTSANSPEQQCQK